MRSPIGFMVGVEGYGVGTMRATGSSAIRISPGQAATEFPIRRLGERLAIITADEHLDEPRARRFARTVLDATEDGVREIVLNLSTVERHAWPAVYALCELEARLSETCSEPVAAAANERLVADLCAVGLDRVWSLSATAEDALAEILRRPA